MKRNLLSIALLVFTSFTFAQGSDLWKATVQKSNAVIFENKASIAAPQLYELNVDALKKILLNAPQRGILSSKSSVILSFPNTEGKLERFKILEASNMEPELAAKYPQIKSYVGQGIDNPTATIYFSLSPLGLQTMAVYADKSAVFIEPYTKDLSTYTVYRKSDKKQDLSPFECKVIDKIEPQVNADALALRPNADDGTLRTFRLAMSVTGEYTAYFGGTKALALAAINNTMTRVNGVFEKDFGVRMNLIANTDAVIYTSASTDPYSGAAAGSGGAWNAELQSTLTAVIGEANYDVGHLFGGSGGGGNAGCIGCVCVNGQKGSGYTSPADGIPSGDKFDIDYVAHELGHQFGGNHTFTQSNEGTGVQVEPGSGSTIMGYAGITSYDVQPNSDAYFHAVSIQQITNNIKTKTCQTNTATGNSIPTASAGLDYTIPKSTPFELKGSGTDANGDVLTYGWEQMDNGPATNPSASPTRTTGPAFRSYLPSTVPSRYFPRLATILAGGTTTAGTEGTVEALPSVARTMNFRLTVRDNRANGSANNSDDMIVTVNGTAGPFTVSAPNTAVSYVGGSSQTITWNVAGTTANGVNCANVDILLSTNGGNSYTALLTATPNDGTQVVTIPNTAGTQNRIMVKGNNHIFFDVSNTNFTITAGTSDTVAPSAPTNLAASGTTQTTTTLNWTAATDNVGVTGYDVYQGAALLGSVTATSASITGLTASTSYTFSVKAKDAAGNISATSNVINVTTLATASDTTAPSAPASLVASGTTTTSTNLSWTASTDNVGVTGYEVYRGTTLLTTVTTTTYSVTGLTAGTAYSFSVKARDAASNVSASSNVVNVTTLSSTVTYCASQGNSVADELIGRVAFNTINNASTGGTGYTNFTAISTNAARGTAYTISITPTWTSTKYNEGYGVWIDYNKDGDFIDAGELVYSRAASQTTPVTGTITIPTTALLGATRMRVSMKYNGIPTSCEAFPYGQVEDYTVNIVATAKGTASLITVQLYPNPVKGSVLNITSVTNEATYRIINMIGQEVKKGKIDNNTVNVAALNAGTYLLEINANDEKIVKRFIKE